MRASVPTYVGRFAPSPTGPLHLGSLVAALASYLEARARGGRWLLRMEDLDTPRVVPGAADGILRTLERLGLEWDGDVVRQSNRLAAYAQALDELRSEGLIYACDCSRRDVVGPYPGTCRDRHSVPEPHALRFSLAREHTLVVNDRWQGPLIIAAASLGDPVVRRRDGLYAYHLAVVVDDDWQRVTDVVRGADLLDSTPVQRALQNALSFAAPTYAHAPLLIEPDGSKLAKSRRTIALDDKPAGIRLFQALRLLGQSSPAELERASPREILKWAHVHWNPSQNVNRARIVVNESDE